MSAVDFLFGGKAPTPGTSSTTSQVQLPDWYTQYTTDMLARLKQSLTFRMPSTQGRALLALRRRRRPALR